jgi:hypothetical protein
VREFPLPTGLWPDQDQPEQECYSDQEQHWEQILHEGGVYGGLLLMPHRD